MVAMHEQRKHLHDISLRLRKSLTEKALKTAGATNIVPVMIGDDSLAVLLAGKMQKKGYLIFPVRPPAVPEGTARFRLSLTADMEWRDIKSVAKDISTLF
jgi:8-amino-7-oxononanoate synthase